MDHYERSKLADAIREQKFAAGEQIIKQGDDGNVFYIIEEGEAVATKSINGEEAKEVMNYSQGDYFGERALLKNEPRAANVVALTDIKLVSLERASFKRLLGPLDDILMRNMSNYK